MLIDDLSIKRSGSVAHQVIYGPAQDIFINAWATQLQAAGWTLIESLHASASVTFPLGVPISDGVETFPKTVVGCNAPPGFLSIGAQEYSLYDPYHQIPGSTTACIFVPMGLTYADTLDNLAAAINAGFWVAVIVPNSPVSFTLNLTALAAGPEFNELLVQSSGFLSGTAVTAGGGWKLRSAGDSSSAVYDCAMTAADRDGAGDNYLAGLLKFDFTINGEHVVYQLLNDVQGTLGFMGALGVGAVASYTLIANPYGFAVFDQPRDTTTHQYRAISLFAMAPYFPTANDSAESESFVPAYAVCVIGPNQIGGSPCWNNANMAPNTQSLDDVPFLSNGINPGARVLALRSPVFALHTVYGVPIFMGAYVQFGSNDQETDPAWVVGKLWDCAVVSDFVATGALLEGFPYLTLGYGDNTDSKTVCSFLMASGGVSLSPVGQSVACATGTGSPGSDAYENTGH
jgi:hypothetical protein